MKHVAYIVFPDNSLAQAGQAENLSSTGQEIFTLSKKDKGTACAQQWQCLPISSPTSINAVSMVVFSGCYTEKTWQTESIQL